MLLDTCALLWLVEGGRKIGRPVLRQIEIAPALAISAITAFELARKVHDGKLMLSDPVAIWIRDALEHHGISILPVDLEVGLKASALPPIHADPCDRFIIATALLNDWPVVTADSRFAEYGVETLL